MTLTNRMRWILPGMLLVLVSPGVRGQVITDFEPKYGSPGDPMIIYGSGFQTPTIYVNYWNGIPLVMGGITSDSVIAVTAVPSGITTGPLSVRRNAGAWNYSADVFTLIDPWAFIERVEPGYGAPGNTVLIHGAHFGTSPVVKFGGVTAVAGANGNGTLITAYVPAGAPSNSVITVTAQGGTYTNPEPFTVVGAGPFIAQFTPGAGSDTTPVTLVGLHFTGANSVKFNGASASFDPVVNDTQIKAYAPSGVTTGPISVTTPSGTYTTATPFYGPIRLNGFNPSSGPTATEVVISGTNFTDAISVKFGGFTGVEASFVVSNNNQIVASVPGDAQTGILVVATPAGSFPTASNFVVTPSITGFTPTKGAAGTPVQITGTRLVDGSGQKPVVKFNGVNASVTTYNALQVVATAPVSSSGLITLATADGTNATASRFYYPPQISGFTPNADPPGATVTLTGESLIDATSVLFNGVPSTNFSVLGNTSIEAEVPTGITTGPLTVTTPGGTVNSAALYFAAPVISAFAPDSGGPGTSVTVFGANFNGTTSVKFNGVNASFSDVTGSQLTAVVPAGAATGPITVTAPAGTATSAELFVVPRLSDIRVNTFLHTPEPVYVGQDLTLTIVPSNDGPDAASNVTASVWVAPGLSVKSAASSAPGDTVNTNANPVVFNLGTLTIFDNPTLTLVLVPELAGRATNTVTLASVTFDPNTGNNTDRRVSTVLPKPELTIERGVPPGVRIGWPASLAGFVLQTTAAPTNEAPWVNVPTAPVIEGSQQVVTEPGTGPARYYRLKK